MNKSKFFIKIKSLISVTTGGGVVFAAVNIVKGNEKFYEEFLMPATKYIPPEISHNLAVLACKYRIFSGKISNPESLATTFLGLKLKNPLGIAAGFDKDGKGIEGLERIGFGFIEIGSVTPQPQPGNPKPRVFRLPADRAIINRYGFNSEGHQSVCERLKTLRENHFNGIIGVNLGKNKSSEDAANDYRTGVRIFAPLADYLVINVSSPNTPGLRNLQSKDDLRRLLRDVLSERQSLPIEYQKIPILLKLAPDLSAQDLKDIAKVIKSKECRVDGLIISNTTIDRRNLLDGQLSKETGGLSGAPLTQRSTKLIAEMYSLTGGSVPIIGVGGIFTGKDAFDKIEAGASLIQIYTSFIYHGPPIVNRIKNELDEILKYNSYKNVNEAVGKNHKKYLY